jgi:hypothetical protein
VLAAAAIGGAAVYVAIGRVLGLREPSIAVSALIRSARGRIGMAR